MKRRGDTLMDRILDTGDEAAAHALLEEFFDDYPVDELRRLLLSGNEKATRVGAWLASELGWRARPVIGDLLQLLESPSRYVRFFVVDSILAGSGVEHGVAIAAAIGTMEDTDGAVRWKALNFLARAGREHLVASIPYIGQSALASAVAWLSNQELAFDRRDVIARIGSDQPLERRVAVAAAARAATLDRSVLEHAAESSDPEVRSFAEEQLNRR